MIHQHIDIYASFLSWKSDEVQLDNMTLLEITQRLCFNQLMLTYTISWLDSNLRTIISYSTLLPLNDQNSYDYKWKYYFVTYLWIFKYCYFTAIFMRVVG